MAPECVVCRRSGSRRPRYWRNGSRSQGYRTRGHRGGRGGKGIQRASASSQRQPFNGINGIFFPRPRPQAKCYRCNQPGHRHTECTATITLNPSPNNSDILGLGNTAMVTTPPPPPSSAGPSASTSTMVPTYSSPPSGGQQHPQRFIACLASSGKYGLNGQTHCSRADGHEV